MKYPFCTIGSAVLLAASGSSCAKVMYDGPRRPSESVARLTSDDGPDLTYCKTKIVKVDGKAVNGGAFEILPGRHILEVESKDKRRGVGDKGSEAVVTALGGPLAVALANATPGLSARGTDGPATACFKAKAGHTYVVQSRGDYETYQLEVLDEETATDVKDFCRQ